MDSRYWGGVVELRKRLVVRPIVKKEVRLFAYFEADVILTEAGPVSSTLPPLPASPPVKSPVSFHPLPSSATQHANLTLFRPSSNRTATASVLTDGLFPAWKLEMTEVERGMSIRKMVVSRM